MTPKEEIAKLKAELEAKTQENAQLKATGPALTMKVSAKGAVSVYGLGRWPVTLYGEQWPKVLDIAEDIKAFIEANRSQLTWKKDEKKAA